MTVAATAHQAGKDEDETFGKADDTKRSKRMACSQRVDCSKGRVNLRSEFCLLHCIRAHEWDLGECTESLLF